MAGITFETSGFDELVAKLRHIADEFPQETGRAMYEEYSIEATESMRRTPVADPAWYLAQGYGVYKGAPGTLRASHHVTQPEISGDEISVTIEVGGAAAPYAVYVHENLEAIHPNGQAKFLESTIDESRPYMAQRVADRIDLNRVAG